MRQPAADREKREGDMDLGHINVQQSSPGQGGLAAAVAEAERLYQHATCRNWREVVRWRVAGQITALPTMADLVKDSLTRRAIEVGLRTVPLAQIVGTVEPARSTDFDDQFRPVMPHLKERWIAMAICFQQGHCAQPVELMEADDLYFVVDGHARVSVARAMGRDTIPACVTSLVPMDAAEALPTPGPEDL